MIIAGIVNASSLQNEHYEPFDGFCIIGYVKLQQVGIDISIDPNMIRRSQTAVLPLAFDRVPLDHP